jgi:hypothetical protein
MLVEIVPLLQFVGVHALQVYLVYGIACLIIQIVLEVNVAIFANEIVHTIVSYLL